MQKGQIYSHSRCNKSILFTRPLQQAYFIHSAPRTMQKRQKIFTPPPRTMQKGKNIFFDFSRNLGHSTMGLGRREDWKRSSPRLCRGCVGQRGGGRHRDMTQIGQRHHTKNKKNLKNPAEKHQILHRKSLMACIFSVIWGAPRDTTSTKTAPAGAAAPERPRDDRNLA